QIQKSIIILSKYDELKTFESFKFKKYAQFTRAIYSGGAVFDFPSSMDKSISNKEYIHTIKSIDKKVFSDDRFEYISKAVMKKSSLLFSTTVGYQHTYPLDKSTIKISPFLMIDEFSSDAEKFIRGLIYHRGLKKLISYIPKNIPSITALYEKYKFKFDGEYYLMYKNEKPNINIEAIYGI
ncbi:MAG: hypothetical protein U9R16_02805, partial [Campylobacterota bacterium]|nr:hypothetical protein [Campylobacterota bacterium]